MEEDQSLNGGSGGCGVEVEEKSIQKPSNPVSAILTSLSSSSQTIKAIDADAAVIQRPMWDTDDCEFNCRKDELIL
ncbi:hypothetical protein PanWU01x14_018260 [Parasponia andersonii]|uniref:Uncharacterized protein n=1 Tax=Parasponia andersonii TaxID=3476 RepID=A0A2P5DZ45_PARAD|nr:hypothetical protein PanWU01x14_018260 [Parasponia andersonii]